jgi:hypothetical protein
MPYDPEKGWIFLSYLDRFQPDLSQQFDGGSSFELAPSYYSDRDESKAWVIRLTGREFTKMLSSLTKGAILTYPFESDSVVWSFTSSMEGKMAEICAEIINCITTDSDTQNAIDNRVTNIVNASEQALLEKIQELFNLQVNPPTGGDCNDKLFACIKQTITYMDSKNLDWLESVSASFLNNLVEITNVVSAISILDELSIDAISEFLTWITDNALDVYPATSTTELLDEVACDIFCAVKDTCVVTLQDIHNYFYNRVNDAHPISFTDFIQFGMEIATIIAGGDSRLVFDAIMLSTTSTALLLDGLLGGVIKQSGGASDLYTHMKAYSNDSDNDWTVLCDCAPAITMTADYGTINSDNGSTIRITSANVAGTQVWYLTARDAVNALKGFTVTSITAVSGTIVSYEYYDTSLHSAVGLPSLPVQVFDGTGYFGLRANEGNGSDTFVVDVGYTIP